MCGTLPSGLRTRRTNTLDQQDQQNDLRLLPTIERTQETTNKHNQSDSDWTAMNIQPILQWIRNRQLVTKLTHQHLTTNEENTTKLTPRELLNEQSSHSQAQRHQQLLHLLLWYHSSRTPWTRYQQVTIHHFQHSRSPSGTGFSPTTVDMRNNDSITTQRNAVNEPSTSSNMNVLNIQVSNWVVVTDYTGVTNPFITEPHTDRTTTSTSCPTILEQPNSIHLAKQCLERTSWLTEDHPGHSWTISDNCKYNYQTDIFWSNEFQQFAYTKHDLEDWKWYWDLLPKETALSDAQRLTHKELRSVFGDDIIFGQQLLDSSLLPWGYSAYLKLLSREAKTPSKAPMESLSESNRPMLTNKFPQCSLFTGQTRRRNQALLKLLKPQPFKPFCLRNPSSLYKHSNVLAVTTATTTPNNIIMPPDNFDGRPTRFKLLDSSDGLYDGQPIFFYQWHSQNPVYFNTLQTWNRWPWGTAKMEHYANTTWPTWDAFKKLFTNTFYPADVQQSAVNSLSNLWQKDGQQLLTLKPCGIHYPSGQH